MHDALTQKKIVNKVKVAVDTQKPSVMCSFLRMRRIAGRLLLSASFPSCAFIPVNGLNNASTTT